ncbi:extracellular solute-binding protein [Vibrio lamellibrachiae]|uniref:extracellular solute-binding protein n=1 Tax=Vibrio lamellibrachiae TaxID=2910253 RepID=UPI003D0AEE30
MKNKLATAILATLAFSANAYDIDAMSWQEIQVQAKEEGQITFSVWYLQPAWREFVKSFEEDTGIKVRIPEGSHDGNRNKLQAESRRNSGSMDVVALGASAVEMLDTESTFQTLKGLPEFDKLSTRTEGVESSGYGVVFWGNQTGLAYDPSRLSKADLPQSFEQLNQFIKNNPNAMGVNDPNHGGAGGRFVEAAIRHVSGDFEQQDEINDDVVESWGKTWDWFQGYKSEILITASNADSLTRINDGEIVIAPAWEDHLAGLQKRGAITDRLKFYIPEFGMSGGGNFVTIADNSKNKAASMVFINWLTSPDVQSALNAEFGVAPQHPDANAGSALATNEMRELATDTFSASYGAEVKKQFTRNVLMR